MESFFYRYFTTYIQTTTFKCSFVIPNSIQYFKEILQNKSENLKMNNIIFKILFNLIILQKVTQVKRGKLPQKTVTEKPRI